MGIERNKYLSRSTKIRYVISTIIVAILFVIGFTCLFMLPLAFIDYNSAVIGFFSIIVILSGIGIYFNGRNMLYAEQAIFYSKYLMDSKDAYLEINKLPIFHAEKGFSTLIKEKYKSNKLRAIEMAIKKGYLLNCTVEFYDGKARISLEKNVVKDSCPNCGAPIVGIINDTYICRYCGTKISDVVEKKNRMN